MTFSGEEIDFPDPRTFEYVPWVLADDLFFPADDIVHFGGCMTVANLRRAYRQGIFPWFTPGLPLPWHSPDPRAILVFDDLKLPRSLKRIARVTDLTFTIDHDFDAVIRACSQMPRPGQHGTWITADFIDAYIELHNAGDAHSVEAWTPDGELVGGLYGVDAGGIFCGESMFYRTSNASKLCLIFLVEHLSSRGSAWLDAQVMTPHFRSLGACEIARDDFLDRLHQAQSSGVKLF